MLTAGRARREFDFVNAPPLQLVKGQTVVFNCEFREIHVDSPNGRILIPDGATLIFNQCYIRSYKDESVAQALPAGPEAAFTQWGGIAGSQLQATDSLILYPLVVRLRPRPCLCLQIALP